MRIAVESESRNPAPASLAEVEKVINRIQPDQEELVQWFRDYTKHHKSRTAHDLDYLRKYVPEGSTVLDVGAVPLLLTAALADTGYKVSGVDVAPERFSKAIARIGVDVVKCNVETEPLPFADNTFDAIVVNEVFEHLRIDLIGTFKEVARVCRSAAVLLLSTPNLRSYAGILNFLLRGKVYTICGDPYREYAKLKELGHMGHVREYTPVEVVEFLKHFGFTTKRIIYRGSIAGWKYRMVSRFFPSLRPFFTVVALKCNDEPQPLPQTA